MAEDCCRYGAENTDDAVLAKAASIYGDARKHVEKEQEEFNKLLSSQVGYIVGLYCCKRNLVLTDIT